MTLYYRLYYKDYVCNTQKIQKMSEKRDFFCQQAFLLRKIHDFSDILTG